MSGILTSQKRPRNLSWFHAGPLLFGDWGTSRLYVLGLAFALTGFAAPYYLLGLTVLLVAVAWAYTIVCEHFPEGGGVYTSARQISPILGVVGGTLLLADYIVTAALSTLDAFHYFGVPEGPGGWVIFACCAGAIGVLGLINWFGARRAGQFALLIAVLALLMSLVIAAGAMPFVPAGLLAMEWGSATLWGRWTGFVSIILALSGVEAVANMTGIMKEPVERTSKRTIWPVLGEVAGLNMVFGVVLIGVVSVGLSGAMGTFDPADPATRERIKHAAMRVLAERVGDHWLGPPGAQVLGVASAAVYGLLLISAANTVIGGMVSVLYNLARDRELPGMLARLNYSGVPWIPLAIAVAAPAIVLAFVHDLEALAHLYAIGVCGAIGMNLVCSALNRRLAIRARHRAGLWAIAAVIVAVWLTIAGTRPEAALFAGGLVGLALAARWTSRRLLPTEPVFPAPAMGWMAELDQRPLALDAGRPRIMLAARGRSQSEFAVDLARRRGATLFAIYVRTLRVLDAAPGTVPRIEEDPDAQEALGTTAVLARRAGVPFVPIYVTGTDIAEEILDYTVTFGCDTLILGQSRRSRFSRRVAGDVVARVTAMLPAGITLTTRAAGDPIPPTVVRGWPGTSTPEGPGSPGGGGVEPGTQRAGAPADTPPNGPDEPPPPT